MGRSWRSASPSQAANIADQDVVEPVALIGLTT